MLGNAAGTHHHTYLVDMFYIPYTPFRDTEHKLFVVPGRELRGHALKNVMGARHMRKTGYETQESVGICELSGELGECRHGRIV